MLLAALGAGTARAAPTSVSDATTAGRRLIAGELPAYPAEEMGRWSESCVAFYYDVRADGRPDRFVLLEVERGRHDKSAYTSKGTSGEEFRHFALASLRALYQWRFSPAAAPSEEIAVFNFDRTSLGGHLMKISARRLDLKTPDPQACRALEVAAVRKFVTEARAHKNS